MLSFFEELLCVFYLLRSDQSVAPTLRLFYCGGQLFCQLAGREIKTQAEHEGEKPEL